MTQSAGTRLETSGEQPSTVRGEARAGFSTPVVLFPADAAVPNAVDSAHEIASSSAFPNAHKAALAAVRELTDALSEQVLPPASVGNRLEDIHHLIRGAVEELERFLPAELAIDELANRETRLAVLRTCFPNESAESIFGYAVYDEYFNVVRLPDMSRTEFGDQMLRTLLAVLKDLPQAMLGLDDLHAILHAIEVMLELCWPSVRTMRETVSVDGLQKSRDDVGFGEHTIETVASYRWKVGHHLFAFCTMWCRHCLHEALRNAEAGNSEDFAENLQAASTLLRGTTGAMWYSSNFPARVYTDIVRPQMEATETSGFSGSQNLEYSEMLRAKRKLTKTISSLLSDSATVFAHAPGVAAVYSVLETFYEIDIEDTEHHTLLAAQRIGREPSLLQKEVYNDLAMDDNDPPAKTALEMLREMGDEKRTTFETLRNKVIGLQSLQTRGG